ncbi:MAG: hypothetical protein E7467_01220 [Ruminococcaceae bacterium]|nr:hypothetical protein [Oscillospiraceae bacterium]
MKKLMFVLVLAMLLCGCREGKQETSESTAATTYGFGTKTPFEASELRPSPNRYEIDEPEPVRPPVEAEQFSEAASE